MTTKKTTRENEVFKNLIMYKNLIHVPTLNKNDCKHNLKKKLKF